METKICKYCKEEINAKATRCPRCSGKLGVEKFLDIGENVKSGCFLVLLIPVIIIIIWIIVHFVGLK